MFLKIVSIILVAVLACYIVRNVTVIYRNIQARNRAKREDKEPDGKEDEEEHV